MNNETLFFGTDGQPLYPCRCGVTHLGDYGPDDYAHHNCFHNKPLWWDEESGLLMCASCGKTFEVDPTRPIGRFRSWRLLRSHGFRFNWRRPWRRQWVKATPIPEEHQP